jgi:sugar O-acyltransferase (sialic acid O-acetyltransferase NeuD family)
VSTPIYAIYGASGFGREVMPIARDQLKASGIEVGRLVFIDDQPGNDFLNGVRVLNYRSFLELDASERHVSVAVADSKTRRSIVARCQADSITPWTIAATNVVKWDDVVVGEGAILSAFVTLTSNIRIGRYFHANIYSYVAHDCVIGDFVTFAPSVKCNGNVVIEDHAYLGTGAIIKQGQQCNPLVIGRGAIVGMGAVVTKSVPAGLTVVGNPARPLKQQTC